MFGYADCKSNKHGPKDVVKAIFLCINKILLDSFFVHGRKSRDRFRICIQKQGFQWEIKDIINCVIVWKGLYISKDGNLKTDYCYPLVNGSTCTTYLSEIFNGVDVVMRRWTDQSYARYGETRLSNVLRYFMTWQLSTFSRLGSLCHLDLELISVTQVWTSHAKPAWCHLETYKNAYSLIYRNHLI